MKDKKLTYMQRSGDFSLLCYVDSDWTGYSVERRSTSGDIIKFNENVVSWKTKKRKSVVKSSTHAKYTALSETVTEIKYILGILTSFQINEPLTWVKVYEDNSGILALVR